MQKYTKAVLDCLLSDTHCTFEAAAMQVYKEYDTGMAFPVFAQSNFLADVYVRALYRERVLEAAAKSGLPVRIFGEKYQAMGANYSSEMDIELYLGIFVLFAAMFAIIKLWKKFDTALAGGCALFALLYACVAHIPVINKIVYHIPVLGGFRASGRMLFAFYFFVFLLSALGTSEFLKEIKKKDIVLLKKAAKGLLGLTAVLILTSVSAVCLIVAREQQGAYFIQIQSAFKTALIVAVLMLIVCWILSKDNIYKITLTIQKKRSIICIFLLGITLYETLPYSMATTPTDYKSGISQEPVVEKIQENIGQYKIFDAFGNVDGSHMSIISQNRNAIRKIASLNAYTAYNNPLLCKYLKNLGSQVTDIPFNYSGLLTGSLDNTNNVLIQNDLLSMTGVKYVIDSEGAIAKNNGMIYSNQSPTESCYSSQFLQITHKPGEIGIFETPFSMMTQEQEQTPQCYKVVITLTEEKIQRILRQICMVARIMTVLRRKKDFRLRRTRGSIQPIYMHSRQN